jgi:hypothetical protein
MTSTNEAKAVADIIAQQLGGLGRLSAMIGAKNFAYAKEGRGMFSFQFPNRKRSAPNCIKIVLEASDTYTVHFFRIGRADFKELGTVADVYADNLKSLIEDRTGLFLSL